MRAPIIIAVYLAGAFLTGGYYWNHRADQSREGDAFAAVYAGMCWPIYWSARGAIQITK